MPAVKVSPDARLPILGVRAGDLPTRSLVVGDPARAEKAAARLDGARELARTREYVTFVGQHQGTRVAVVSHGVGSAGAAVCFEELYRAGAELVIRAGTAGGMQPDVLDGHLGRTLHDRALPRPWPRQRRDEPDLDGPGALREHARRGAGRERRR